MFSRSWISSTSFLKYKFPIAPHMYSWEGLTIYLLSWKCSTIHLKVWYLSCLCSEVALFWLNLLIVMSQILEKY